ncbi:uncharacterized protein IAS62_001044 [Cryptococcus decagattii]|uniref:RING-type domain-containing protein n=1 Tax=Cryptococcus decagattii TaxID=1859122 RepID=A0ABZ2APC7_9TREE
MDNRQHPPQQQPLPPIFSMTIAMPGPPPSRPSPQPDGSDAQQAPGNDQQPAQESTIYWTFHIGPGSAHDNQPSNEHSAAPGPDGRGGEPRGPAEGGGDASNNAPPPWLFPPFFQFFMPRREPQPDPEKAAELLRSLPTVGKRLLHRVNNIVAAQDVDNYEDDDDRGWKCNICLEGILKENFEKSEDKEAVGGEKTEGKKEGDKGTGVKALPCNHLFHGDCLEPWFTTHHTCPTCRLDLDPLQTLNIPPHPGPAHPSSLRPLRTGAGRPTSNVHPYSRDQNRNGERNQSGTVNQVPADRSGSVDNSGSNTPQGREQRSSLTPHLFIFAGPHHPRESQQEHSPEATNDAAATLDGPTPQPAEPSSTNLLTGGEASVTPGENSRPSSSHTPLFDPAEILGAIFGGRPSASPMPMRRHSPSIPSSPGENATQRSNVPPSDNTEATSTSQSAGSEPQSGSSVGSQSAPEQPAQPPPSGRPQPERRAHIQIIQEALGQLPFIFNSQNNVLPLATAFPFPGMAPTGERPGAERPVTPNGVNDMTSGSTARASAGGDAAAASDTRQPHTQTSAKQPFVPQSLESWIEEKEKSLGWRCDAPECVYGPSVSEEDDGTDAYPPSADDELGEGRRDKEMVNIFSAVQPPLSSAEAIEAHETDHNFTLLACTHRWHRCCLEIAERSAKRMSKDDGEGRVWVRCGRCRKSGWITPVAESTESGVGRKRKEAEMTV